MTALVVGGSGLIGSELLHRISSSSTYTRVVSIGRRPLPFPTPIGVEHRVVDLFGPLPDDLRPDVVFCSLGTTIKDAGSEEAFLHIDHDLPVHIATEARARNTTTFVVISSMGADRDSRVFYNRVKGLTESELEHVGFDRLCILRPSLLLGNRREPRMGEEIASLLMQTFAWLIPKRWRAVRAADVAAVMLLMAEQSEAGVTVALNHDILRLAGATVTQ